MFLAAMAGLGVDFAPLGGAFRAAGADVEIAVLDGRDKGFAGKRVVVRAPEPQPLRRLSEMLDVIEALPVAAVVRGRTLDALKRLAEAEAQVRGCGIDDVRFHEGAAVGILVDVAGAFWALETLGVRRVTCSRLPWFTGTAPCAHGAVPLPAPVTAFLLQGKPVYPTEFSAEIITPVGALMVDRLVDDFAPGPNGTVLGTGLGLGTMELGVLNGLRAFLLDAGAAALERIMVLEANVDHLAGEEIGGVLGTFLDAGALDVLFLPGVMKQNRPGGLLQILCRPEDLPRIRDLAFAQTMTSGLRITETMRAVLPPAAATGNSSWGEIAAKQSVVAGESSSSPEFEALQDLARRTGRSVAQLRYLLGEK